MHDSCNDVHDELHELHDELHDTTVVHDELVCLRNYL